MVGKSPAEIRRRDGGKIGHLANREIPQMPDVPGNLAYNGWTWLFMEEG